MEALRTAVTIKTRADLGYDLVEVDMPPEMAARLQAHDQFCVGDFRLRIIETIEPGAPLFCRVVEWLG